MEHSSLNGDTALLEGTGQKLEATDGKDDEKEEQNHQSVSQQRYGCQQRHNQNP
jgi:hypothetical protein